MGHLHADKKILNRVKRLQGQIGAVQQALHNPEHGCMEVLQQVAAIKGAVNGLMNELIESHLRHHVIGDQCAIDEHELEEFMKLLKRYA